MANEAYFPGIPETDKVKNSQYVIINNEKTGKPDKIRLDKFITNLSLATDTTPTTNITSVTHGDAQKLINNFDLIAGEHYLISDKADNGIVLLAISANQFSLEGQGIFLNPDFQTIGTRAADIQEVWYSGIEPLTVGLVVIWNGVMYETTPDVPGNYNGLGPDNNPEAYTLIPKSVTNGYIEEVDFILYDFANDIILERNDKRNNKVRGYSDEQGSSAIDFFQWGNDSVQNNTVKGFAIYKCFNNKGRIFDISCSDESLIISNENNLGEIYSCTFSGGNTYNCNFNLGISFYQCIIDSRFELGSITFNASVSENNKSILPEVSTFSTTLDMLDGTIFNNGTGTLTIPNSKLYFGTFTLNNNSGRTISKIVNLTPHHTYTFKVKVGDVQTFSHTTVVGITVDKLISDVAAANTLTGLNGDFIQYKKVEANSVEVNQRYNAVISA